MKNSFEQDYKKHEQEQTPDLWNKIEAQLRDKEVSAVQENKKPGMTGKSIRKYRRYMPVAAAALMVMLLSPAWLNLISATRNKTCADLTGMAAQATEDMHADEDMSHAESAEIAPEEALGEAPEKATGEAPEKATGAGEEKEEEAGEGISDKNTAAMEEIRDVVSEDKDVELKSKNEINEESMESLKLLHAKVQILEEAFPAADSGAAGWKYLKLLITEENREAIAAVSEENFKTITLGKSYEISYVTGGEKEPYDILVMSVSE